MFTIITLPAGAAADMVANVSTLFTDLWLLLSVAIGIPLAFYVIRRTIALIPKGR